MKSYLDYNIPIENTSGLPNYPIPDKEETLKRFLEWVQPLITHQQYLDTMDLVKDFIKSDDSEKLHAKLEELASRENENWLYDYWFKSYLKLRKPFVPYISVPMVYENSLLDGFPIIEKATTIIYGVANSYRDFQEDDKAHYYIGEKRYSNDQLKGTLASINHIQRDMNQFYINDTLSSNVIVLYKNHIYSIEIMDANKKVSDVNAIYNALKEIYNPSLAPLMPNINFVTAEPNKDIAGDYLAEILEDPRNKVAYQKIKDAIFILHLDDDSPKTPIDKLYCASLDKRYFNRWHGKGLVFSIAKNGAMSFIVDHSNSDAGIAMYLTDKMNSFMKDLVFSKVNHKVSYHELFFHLKETLSSKLLHSFEDYKNAMQDFDARFLSLENLSRNTLKENGILSADGFFHIALQAAQKMTYDKIYNTYISVDMRIFFKGRTEANRPVTPKSIDFVQALLDPEENKSKQKELLKEALDAHYHRTLLCRQGKGINRYLYILEELYHDFKDQLNIHQKPLLFDSLAYKTIENNIISTSSYSNKNLKCSYFTPVTQGGLGIYYVVGEQSFAIITCFNEDLEASITFSKNLKICVNKMLEIASYK